jgi:type IV secretion system protein VirB8
LNRYADGTHVRAEVQAVSFLKRERGAPAVVQVRFVAATQHGPGTAEDLVRYVATLVVAYGPPSGDLRLRALNPLGFKVLEYRREPEVAGALAAGGAPERAGSGATP